MNRVVSWDDLEHALSRQGWNRTMESHEVMDHMRLHLCRQVRMKAAPVFFFNGQNPVWVHERADRDASRGPQNCYMMAGTLLAAARACGASPDMEQNMAQAIMRLRDYAPDRVNGLLRETKNLVGEYFPSEYRPNLKRP